MVNQRWWFCSSYLYKTDLQRVILKMIPKVILKMLLKVLISMKKLRMQSRIILMLPQKT